MNTFERHNALVIEKEKPIHRLRYEGTCHCGGVLYRWEDTGKLACHFCSYPMKMKMQIEGENILTPTL